MATLTIRKLDDALYERLKARAKANERSLEAEARDALAQHAPASPPDRNAIFERLLESHRRRVGQYGYWDGDSTELIRKIRDEE